MQGGKETGPTACGCCCCSSPLQPFALRRAAMSTPADSAAASPTTAQIATNEQQQQEQQPAAELKTTAKKKGRKKVRRGKGEGPRRTRESLHGIADRPLALLLSRSDALDRRSTQESQWTGGSNSEVDEGGSDNGSVNLMSGGVCVRCAMSRRRRVPLSQRKRAKRPRRRRRRERKTPLNRTPRCSRRKSRNRWSKRRQPPSRTKVRPHEYSNIGEPVRAAKPRARAQTCLPLS